MSLSDAKERLKALALGFIAWKVGFDRLFCITAHYRSITTHYNSITAYYRPVTAYYRSIIAYYRLSMGPARPDFDP